MMECDSHTAQFITDHIELPNGPQYTVPCLTTDERGRISATNLCENNELVV